MMGVARMYYAHLLFYIFLLQNFTKSAIINDISVATSIDDNDADGNSSKY